jgi:hypothetical protein
VKLWQRGAWRAFLQKSIPIAFRGVNVRDRNFAFIVLVAPDMD